MSISIALGILFSSDAILAEWYMNGHCIADKMSSNYFIDMLTICEWDVKNECMCVGGKCF